MRRELNTEDVNGSVYQLSPPTYDVGKRALCPIQKRTPAPALHTHLDVFLQHFTTPYSNYVAAFSVLCHPDEP